MHIPAINAPRDFKSDEQWYILIEHESRTPIYRRRPQAKGALRREYGGYRASQKVRFYEIYKVTPSGNHLIFEGHSGLGIEYEAERINCDQLINGIDW